MWNIDLKQIQQYYEKQVMLREGHIGEREGKVSKLRWICFLNKNEYTVFKLVEITIRWRLNTKKKNRGDEPTGVTIQIYTEMSQENSLYSYIKQTKRSFYFSFAEQEGRTGPVWWGADTSGRGEDVGKGCRRVNMVQILCTHVFKWKNATC
jgi:hypothetical protein